VRLLLWIESSIHVVICVATLCSDVVGYRRFGGPCYFNLQDEVKMKAVWPSETIVSPQHGVDPEGRDTNLHRRENLEVPHPNEARLITVAVLIHSRKTPEF